MSVLRQPCVSESFGAVAEEVDTDCPALAERDDLVEKILRLGSTCLSAAPQVHECEQFVAAVNDLFRVDPKITKYVAKHPPERLDTVMTLIDLPIGRNARQVEHDAWVHRCEGGVPIATVIGGLSTREGRQKLLRHRPLSIPLA